MIGISENQAFEGGNTDSVLFFASQGLPMRQFENFSHGIHTIYSAKQLWHMYFSACVFAFSITK
jgi:hypothetical protein